MPVPPIAITAFGGEVPAIDNRLLDDRSASASVNTWLFSGRIEPIRSLQTLITLQESSKSFFRIPKGAAGINNMVDSYWLEFENANVRVIQSPTVGQEDEGRYYWADGVHPKVMTGEMIKNANSTPVVAPSEPYKLGVPAPDVAPGVVVSGGVSTTIKTVSYVYTWVTVLGEEGPPSPPTTVTGKIDATYTITVTAPTIDDTEGRDLTHTRIYRTVVSVQGVARFFFVAELPIATLTYIDDCLVVPDSVIVNNETLQSQYWFAPPEDLQGLVTMPNGMVAGWRANEVWFCEPYVPHAWPRQYVVGVDPLIVGLGVYDQSLIVLCDGQPYAATGIHPSAMALSKIQPLEPCTSRRSIVNTPNGVLYSSPNGLINITPAGAQNLTIKTILKSQWAERLNLNTLCASIISQGYYCYSASLGGVFQDDAFQDDAFQMRDASGNRPGAYIALNDQRMGITVLDPQLDPNPGEVFNVITDIFNGETMILRGNVVSLVDTRAKAPYAKYRWRSKIFTLPYLQNLSAAKVYYTPQDSSTVPQPTTFRMFAGATAESDDHGLPLRYERTLPKSGEMMRLPSGFKSLYYQFEVEGWNVIDAIHVTQTAHELRGI